MSGLVTCQYSLQVKDETDDERKIRLEMEALAADEADRRKQVRGQEQEKSEA